MPDPVDPREIERVILTILAERESGATACPSEVARRMSPHSWRDLMEPVRAIAGHLAERGMVQVVQRGEPVDVRTAHGPVRLRSGASRRLQAPGRSASGAHWLLPIDPASHAEHLPADWRTRRDATAVWQGVARSQALERWCLRTGYRTMRPGDLVWAYLSRRQEVCAVGTVREVVREGDAWFVLVDWDSARTADLLRAPLPRSDFGQVPMSVCRAGAHAAATLGARYAAGASGPPR